jgi:hypothetical protein
MLLEAVSRGTSTVVSFSYLSWRVAGMIVQNVDLKNAETKIGSLPEM